MPRRPTRRRALHAVATGTAVALAGCAHGPSFAVSGLRANTTSLYTGEAVNVTATVDNRGFREGTYVANLAVGGRLADSEPLHVSRRSQGNVSFDHRFEEPGTYAVEVGDSASIEVEVEPAIAVDRAAPERSALAAGEATTVSVIVRNRASVPRPARLVLSVDGAMRAERTLNLAGGEVETVRFPVGFRRHGDRRIAVNDGPAGVVAVADSWRQFGYDAANTGLDPAGNAPRSEVRVAWRRQLTKGSRASPVVVGDTVYVGYGNPYAANEGGGMYALAAEDGAIRWRAETPGRVRSAPALVDGTVVFGTVDDGAVLSPGTTGAIHGLDATTGRERWVVDAAAPVAAPPTADGGIAYVGAFDPDGTVYALRADGTRRWTTTVGGHVIAAPAVSDGVIYVGDFRGRLHALAAEDGTERWVYATATGELPRVVGAGPAVADGSVYVPNFSWGTGRSAGSLDAVDADTGDRRWRADTSDSMFSSPAVADGTVYAGVGLSVGAWDAETGERRWRLPEGRAGSATVSAPAVVSGTVYVGTSGVNGGTVYALAPDGRARWTADADAGQSSPAVIDETVYLTVGFGTVLALR